MSGSVTSTSIGSSTRNSYELLVRCPASNVFTSDSESDDKTSFTPYPRHLPVVRKFAREDYPLPDKPIKIRQRGDYSSSNESIGVHGRDDPLPNKSTRVHRRVNDLLADKLARVLGQEGDAKKYSRSPRDRSSESSSRACSPLQTLPLLSKDKLPYDFNDVRVHYCSEELDLDDVDDYDDEDNLKNLHHFSVASGGFMNPKIVHKLREIDINRLLPAQYYICKVLFTKSSEPRCFSDVVTLSPTGTGKTLAYLIPMVQYVLERRENCDPKAGCPLAMIFVPHQPLAEMVKQKLDQITEGMGIKTAIFTQGYTVSSGVEFEIAVCTIGTYAKTFKKSLDILKTLEYLVIDEADVMLADFSCFNLFKQLRNRTKCRALLFSATANNYMKGFVDLNNCFFIECGELNTIAENVIQNFIEIDTEKRSSLYGIATGNPTLGFFEGPANPFDALFLILKSLPKPLKTIIFCKRKVTVEFLAHKLVLIGANAAPIHGTFGSKMRNDIIGGFEKGKIDILVATRLITRGVDLDVNTVINYDLPLEVTEYIHRIGRCGRNGARGIAYTFLDFNNFSDYLPSVIKAIALQVNEMTLKKNNRKSLPKFFTKRIDAFVADELRKRNLYLRRVQQDQQLEKEDDE
ncbi:hypothetical protein FO519_007479 [Halicephalobus sp. NKZ332]|nr:hypothetical protein FO519_007479 [Halicephalobus sp. NKZ332]